VRIRSRISTERDAASIATSVTLKASLISEKAMERTLMIATDSTVALPTAAALDLLSFDGVLTELGLSSR
jgi:hypothetical protein